MEVADTQKVFRLVRLRVVIREAEEVSGEDLNTLLKVEVFHVKFASLEHLEGRRG